MKATETTLADGPSSTKNAYEAVLHMIQSGALANGEVAAERCWHEKIARDHL